MCVISMCCPIMSPLSFPSYSVHWSSVQYIQYWTQCVGDIVAVGCWTSCSAIVGAGQHACTCMRLMYRGVTVILVVVSCSARINVFVLVYMALSGRYFCSAQYGKSADTNCSVF